MAYTVGQDQGGNYYEPLSPEQHWEGQPGPTGTGTATATFFPTTQGRPGGSIQVVTVDSTTPVKNWLITGIILVTLGFGASVAGTLLVRRWHWPLAKVLPPGTGLQWGPTASGTGRGCKK
jgi:hypothetical protein